MKPLIRVLIIVATLGVVVGLLLDARDTANTTQKNTQDAQKAPHAFTLLNYAGEVVSLKDSEGKVRVVNVWTSWCPFCVNELPDFVTLQQEYPDRVEVIAINREERKEVAEDFTNELGISRELTFLLDPNDSFYLAIGGFTMPETLFINREGEMVHHQRGFMSLEQMRTQVEEILNNI